MTHIIIIGGGLTGLFAGLLAADQGAKVTIAMKGRGGLALSHGCIDVLDRSAPSRSLSLLPDKHPYQLSGKANLKDAISIFRDLMQKANYSFTGKLSKSMSLLTALGSIKRTSYAPSGVARGDLSSGEPITLGRFIGFRDFYPDMIQKQAHTNGVKISKVIHLPLLDPPNLRDAYSTDYALRFEDSSWRAEVIRMWRPLLPGVKRLGLPAILGMHNHCEILDELEDSLGIDIFEIPSLPPSIPGLRIERILLRQAQVLGVRIIEGAGVIGRVDGRSRGKRVAGVVLHSSGRTIQLDADVVLLATGGILNGGLVAQQDHRIRESVFDLPVHHPTDRSDWVGSSLFHQQAYACSGVCVNGRMQPLGFDEKPIFNNLYAAGGLLAGPDRSREGSRQGIDLVTAYCAVHESLR
ncbi:MAG: anaerobic glycerol-3-phosphate dehydrogenase subunit GlpB [Anaerolineales bacterium]|nr:anaerobic glycerol-3-phosphate dehydrogenase subunit GlpB [Anaerolineales bacterium]